MKRITTPCKKVKSKIITNIKYGAYNGYDFTRQYTMRETYRKTPTDFKNAQRVLESENTLKCNQYNIHLAIPGQSVYTIIYDQKMNHWRVMRDIVNHVHCHDRPFAGSLRSYWLRRGYHNTGLEFGISVWFTKSQAEYALTKLNYFGG